MRDCRAFRRNGDPTENRAEPTKISPICCNASPRCSSRNLAWVTDITEFRTGEGKLYLCVIKDLYDGTVVSWKTQARPTADFVVSTVKWAVEKFSRQDGKPTILHSYHGSQYTSHAYRKCVRHYGLRMSMGRVRTCADNASLESVFA